MSMRVRFLRGTALGGIGNDAAPGDERDLPASVAAQLIASRRAVEVIVGSSDGAQVQKQSRKKGK